MLPGETPGPLVPDCLQELGFGRPAGQEVVQVALVLYSHRLNSQGYCRAHVQQPAKYPQGYSLGLGHGMVVAVIHDAGMPEAFQKLLHARTSLIMSELPVVLVEICTVLAGLPPHGRPDLPFEILDYGLLDLDQLPP